MIQRRYITSSITPLLNCHVHNASSIICTPCAYNEKDHHLTCYRLYRRILVCKGPFVASWLYVGQPWLLQLCSWFIKYGSCNISSKGPQYDITNIGLSDTFMVNRNKWRASSRSVIHTRNSGVQVCFKICKGKDGLACKYLVPLVG